MINTVRNLITKEEWAYTLSAKEAIISTIICIKNQTGKLIDKYEYLLVKFK